MTFFMVLIANNPHLTLQMLGFKEEITEFCFNCLISLTFNYKPLYVCF